MDPSARRKKRASTERSQIKSVKGESWARPVKSLLINMRHSSGHRLCVERRLLWGIFGLNVDNLARKILE
jgi:hypothetical protein